MRMVDVDPGQSPGVLEALVLCRQAEPALSTRSKRGRHNPEVGIPWISEAEAQGIASFTELNDRFLAWAEQVCNTREHAETHQTPLDHPVLVLLGLERACAPAKAQARTAALPWCKPVLRTRNATLRDYQLLLANLY